MEAARITAVRGWKLTASGWRILLNEDCISATAMIRMAAESAHAEGAWIGICGELGADLELTEEFLKMGLDELSVSPSMVLPLRKRIRECE